MRLHGPGPLVVAMLAMLAASPAVGQVTTQRAFEGAFGGAAPQPGVTHSLDLSASLAAAYELNGDRNEEPSIFEQTGPHESMTGGLNYTWQNRRAQVGGSAGGNGRFYNEAQRFVSVNQYAGFGVSAQLGSRATLTMNESVGCGPLHFQGLMSAGSVTPLGVVSSIGIDYSLDEARMCAYDTSGSFGYGLTRRSRLDAVWSVRNTTFGGGSGFQGARSYSVGALFVRNLTSRARLRAGYSRRAGDYAQLGSDDQPVLHDLDIGVDYDRGLSLTRRTYIDFNVGSTIVSAPPTVQSQHRLDYRVVGNAGLNREMGRTWRARAGYNRGVGFIEGLGGLALTDGVTVSLNGFFNRRTDLAATAGVSSATVRSSAAQTPVRARTASSRIRFAIARTWALYGEYTFYSHEIPPDALVFAVSPSLNRQAARVGLTWWIPLVRH